MDADKEKLDMILFALLGRQQLVDSWWTSSNKAFDDRAPISVYNECPGIVKQYLYNQLNGDYS